MPSRILRRFCFSLGLAAVAALMAGCIPLPASSPGDPPAQGTHAGTTDGAATLPSDAAQPSPDTGVLYPSCDEVKTALGPEAAELVIAADADNGEVTGSNGRELSCTWMTPQAASQNLDVQNYGGISLGIHQDPSYTEEAYAPLGWNIDDPRLSVDDAWGLTAGGNYSPDEPVDAASVQVVRNGTVVTIAAAGAMLNKVPELANLTQSWAVGAGLAVLDLTR